MKEWVKPELYVEEFELSQHVAVGCGEQVEIVVKPGETITVGAGCSSKFGNGNGQGHWYADFEITDENNNGKIDWSEVVDQMGAAENGQVTGHGHANHTASIFLPGGEEHEIINKPFSS